MDDQKQFNWIYDKFYDLSLAYAIATDRHGMVRLLFAGKNRQQSQHDNLAQKIVEFGDIQSIRLCLECGLDVTKSSDLIKYAINSGRFDIADEFVRSGSPCTWLQCMDIVKNKEYYVKTDSGYLSLKAKDEFLDSLAKDLFDENKCAKDRFPLNMREEPTKIEEKISQLIEFKSVDDVKKYINNQTDEIYKLDGVLNLSFAAKYPNFNTIRELIKEGIKVDEDHCIAVMMYESIFNAFSDSSTKTEVRMSSFPKKANELLYVNQMERANKIKKFEKEIHKSFHQQKNNKKSRRRRNSRKKS